MLKHNCMANGSIAGGSCAAKNRLISNILVPWATAPVRYLTVSSCDVDFTSSGLVVTVQKHKGRASGSLDGGSRAAMDRMMSTPLASRDTGRITHRISKGRDEFWKLQKEVSMKKGDKNSQSSTNLAGLSCAMAKDAKFLLGPMLGSHYCL